MNVLRGGSYLTVEQFRRKLGLSNSKTIYRALNSNRIKGAVRLGKIWIIPSNAVIIDARIKHGLYSGIGRAIKEFKNNLNIFNN